MKLDEIADIPHLRTWLEARVVPEQQLEAGSISLRAAQRLLPHSVVFIEGKWAADQAFTALPFLRVLLTSGVALSFPGYDAAALAGHAFEAAREAIGTIPPEVFHNVSGGPETIVAAARAVEAAVRSFSSGQAEVEDVAANAAATVFHAHETVAGQHSTAGDYLWDATIADVRELFQERTLASRSLWHGERTEGFEGWDQSTKLIWSRDPQIWSFWLRWWEGVPSGNHLDWDLQKQVALIPDAIWQQGPEAVARAISDIEARHGLFREVTYLRMQVEALHARLTADAEAGPAHRGHNNPPELVEVPEVVAAQVAELIPVLREAEQELARPVPDKTMLSRFASYCLKTADNFVQEATKALGKRAGDAMLVYFAVEPIVNGLVKLARDVMAYAH